MSSPRAVQFTRFDAPQFEVPAPRISREVCSGPHYQCMFCSRVNVPVIWEYDEDAREVFAVTCVDVESCGALLNSRYAHEEGRRDW